jgi:hypothetical protein
MAAARQDALRLYRRVLTLHRQKLDPRMRVLGDAYVRYEAVGPVLRVSRGS